jgi:hypothetical protein
MNTIIQSNPTTNEISPLKIRCNRMGIYVPGDHPTPAEIIPIIERSLDTHQKHQSKGAHPRSGDFAEWKQINDTLTEFLHDLRAAQAVKPITPILPITPIPSPLTESVVSNKIFPAEPGKNPQTAPPQQTQTRNEPGMNPENPGMKPEQPGITRNQTGKCPDQIGNSDQPAPTSSTEPSKNTFSTNTAEDPDSPPKFQSTDQQFIEAATDLHYQRKGRSPFDKLSPQDQAIVIELFDKHHWQAVLKVIAQPPPIGFGLNVGKTALYDFHNRYNKRRRQENIQANVDLINKSSDPTQAFAQIFERLVQIKALSVANNPEHSLSIFDSLITSLTKLRKQNLAERKQAHAEKKANAT